MLRVRAEGFTRCGVWTTLTVGCSVADGMRLLVLMAILGRFDESSEQGVGGFNRARVFGMELRCYKIRMLRNLNNFH